MSGSEREKTGATSEGTFVTDDIFSFPRLTAGALAATIEALFIVEKWIILPQKLTSVSLLYGWFCHC